MPIYEYQCNICHHHFDEMQKITEPPIKLCPKCQGTDVSRLVSAAGFRLKGTGWYVTDFRDKGKPEKKSDTGADKKNTESSPVKTIDSKTTN